MQEFPSQNINTESHMNLSHEHTIHLHVKPTLGWREWVSLPSLQVKRIKAKIDTGAKTSALHAENIEYFTKKGKKWVRFRVFPIQKSKKNSVKISAAVIDERTIKSSIGHETHRPVIEVLLSIGTQKWPIEMTLVNRDLMGFRMLLGRQALKGHFLIDPGHSYLQSKMAKKKKKV